MLRLWRPLALIAFVVALSAQSSLARVHSVALHHAAYRHYRHHQTLADRGKGARAHRRFALRRRHRNVYAFAPTWQENSWQPQNSWQQNSWQQQDVTSDPPFGGFTETYSAGYGRRTGKYREGWNSRLVEHSFGDRSQLQSMAEAAASANGIPVSLVDRVIKRESGGNPRAVNRGNYGLMQIRLGTARAMGYGGSAAGLLDASTNMTYAVRYLAGAYRAAGGNESRAIALYARGYGAGARRVQYASYYGERPQQAAFSDSAYYDSFARLYPIHRVKHYWHRAM